MGKGDASFPKSRRILSRADFKRIMKTGDVRRDARLVCRVVDNPGGTTRIGLVVSRKFGGAVRRNRIKRLLREAFRLSYKELPEGLDVVCVPRVRREYTLEGFRQSLKKLLGPV